MAIQIIGTSGAIQDVDPGLAAARATLRPPEALGAYRLGAFTGLTTAIAAGGVLFTLRNPDPTKLVILQFLKVRATVIAGFTAAQELAFDAVTARGWTVAPSAQTSIGVTAHNLKKRANMAQSIADIRVSGTGAITQGTLVLDGSAFMAATAKTLAAAATVQDAAFEEQFDATNGSDYPIIYGQNEGLVVRNTIAQGAGGTVRFGIVAAWLEANAY